ncbi:hypothetical protein HPB49_004496 [Dermacentor silvarum]|uniref:Uncharacterized protein n=1 Tax=Dermacentor silvarum TaxID=543639 RepID=A0ACB8DV13_DERSI|nr:hypothetical protein HPB49_004496 [Dermacentor silvarum]
MAGRANAAGCQVAFGLGSQQRFTQLIPNHHRECSVRKKGFHGTAQDPTYPYCLKSVKYGSVWHGIKCLFDVDSSNYPELCAVRVCENVLMKPSENILRAEPSVIFYWHTGDDIVFVYVPFKST